MSHERGRDRFSPGLPPTGTRRGRLSRVIAAAFFCSLICLGGCATTVPLLTSVSTSAPQWPEPPFEAQVQWVKSVWGPDDAGIPKGFWQRAVELIAGADKNQIVKPYGVLYDDAGRLFVADPGQGVVHVMDTRKGSYSTITGSGEYRLISPIALAEDEKGGLFITDSAGNAIYRYDVASRVLTPFLRGLGRPTGIVYNPVNKLLYVSETNYSRVVALDENGKQKLTIGGEDSVEGLFNRPTDLAVDANGRVYISDPLNYKIRVFSPKGLLLREFGAMGDAPGELNKPKGISVDGQGRIYVCDSLLDAVQVFDEEGRFIFIFGSNGIAPGEFWMPSGIFIKGDHLFVADTFNRRIQIFSLIAGKGSDGGKGLQQKAR